MKTITTCLPFLCLAGAAVAHPGHVEPQAGHDHYAFAIGAALIVVAIATPIVVRALRKRAAASA